jgi:hypothetical protein
MITLQKLQWNNCFSYGEGNEIMLDERTLTQILGTNGMGKSSIPLIIEEALYNKNSKGIKKADIPNRYVNNGYDIVLDFTRDTDEYRITVNRKTNVKVKFEKNGEDISSHTATNTYKSIQEVIGIDFKTFSQLVYQNTNASLQFLTATDTNRKKFLIELLSLEKYVELFELFKAAARDISLEVSALDSQVSTIEKWLADNKLTDTKVLPMLNLEIDTEEEEKEFRFLTKEIENISEKNKKISKNNSYKDLLRQIDIDEARNCVITKKESYDDLQSELGSLNGVAAGSRKLLEKLEKLGDHCPTCEQEVDPDFKQSLLDSEALKIAEAGWKQDEIETRETTTMLKKFKETGKICIEVLIEVYQWPSWIKTSWKSAWLEYEMTWTEEKVKWQESRKKMNSEQNTIQESK